MKIPEWQYPLYKDIDKENYIFLEWIGKSKKYPKIIGEKNERLQEISNHTYG